MNSDLTELKRRLAEVHDLQQVTLAMEWDQLVMMPHGGAEVRAEQLATLHGLAHERFTDPEVGRLLEQLSPLEESLDRESDDASLIRVDADQDGLTFRRIAAKDGREAFRTTLKPLV